jgi:Predicted nucleoside-diphosphate sugar epimerases
LFYADEEYRPTAHPKILEAGVRTFARDAVLANIPRLREAVAAYDIPLISSILFATMPEFNPVSHGEDAQSATVVPFPLREAKRI